MNGDLPSDCSSTNPLAFSLMTSDAFSEGKLRVVSGFQVPLFSTLSPFYHLFPQNAKWQFSPVTFFFLIADRYTRQGRAGTLLWPYIVLLYSACRYWSWTQVLKETELDECNRVRRDGVTTEPGTWTLEHGHVPRGPRHLVHHPIFRNTP